MTASDRPKRLKLIAVGALMLAIGFVFGFGAKRYSDLSTTRKVDASWLRQSRHCWRGLASSSDEAILHNLSQPAVFRSTFPEYADQTDSAIIEIAQHKALEDGESLPFFAPDGTVRSVPVEEAPQANAAGGKIAAMRRGTDGKKEWVPVEKVDDTKNQPDQNQWVALNDTCMVQDGAPNGFKN